jgi:hypothetical protein
MQSTITFSLRSTNSAELIWLAVSMFFCVLCLAMFENFTLLLWKKQSKVLKMKSFLTSVLKEKTSEDNLLDLLSVKSLVFLKILISLVS